MDVHLQDAGRQCLRQGGGCRVEEEIGWLEFVTFQVDVSLKEMMKGRTLDSGERKKERSFPKGT